MITQSIEHAYHRKYEEHGLKLLNSFPDIPVSIKDKLVLIGDNPQAETVIINSQGGPLTHLDNGPVKWIIKNLSKINLSKDTLLVNVNTSI